MQSDLIALIDMDGTLCDYDGAILRDLKLISSPSEPIVTDIRSEEDKNPHFKERLRLIKKQPNWWKNLEPIPYGMKMVHLLEEMGFKIHILTQGPATTTSAWTEKVEWCQKHLGHIDYDITITRNKGLVYGKVLFDDYPPFAMSWLKHRPRGLVIMPLKTYNNHISHPNIVHHSGQESLDSIKNLLQDIVNKSSC